MTSPIGSCPYGLYYVCQLNSFRGCCAFDPCGLANGCSTTAVQSGTVSATLTVAPAKLTSATQDPKSTADWRLSQSIIPTSATLASTAVPPPSKQPEINTLAIVIGTVGPSSVMIILAIFLFYRKVSRRHTGRNAAGPGTTPWASGIAPCRLNLPHPSELPCHEPAVELEANPAPIHPPISTKLPKPPTPPGSHVLACSEHCPTSSIRATLSSSGRACDHEEDVTRWTGF